MALDLLLLSYANLDTPKGKQLVSSVVNESDILKKLDEYKSRYPNIDISSITSAVQQELSDLYSNRSNTSAEQRAQNRKDRQKERDERKKARQQNRELRQQTAEQRLKERLENAGVVDIDKERTRIGAEIAILISKLKSNRPEITKFTISGTLIDSITSEPIQGAEIFLGVNPNPFPNVTDLDVISIENSKNALLDEEELSILGNISSKDYNNLKESNPQQQYNLARAISNYRTIKYEKALEAEGSPLQSLKGITVTPDQLGALIEKSETVEEMEGLDLRVDPNSFLYIPVKAFKNPNYNVDDGEGLEEITGNRSDQTKNVVTNKTGNFQIDIYIPIIPSTQKCTLDVAILSKKSPENNVNGEPIRGTGYTPGTFVILNGDRTIKTELGIKKVTKFSSVSKKIVTEYNNRIDEAQDKINQIALGAAELVLSQRKTALNKITNAIKSRLIPLVIGLMLQFGITKITEANRKTCPTQGELDDIIRRRNKVNRQMNNIFKSIISNTAIAAAFLVLANVLRGVRLSLDALPFPQAFGIPPGPAGGLIFAQPYSTSAKLQRINEKLEELSAANKELNKAILTNLIFVIAGLATVVILLKAIDNLIQECAEENGVTEVELEEINQELLDLAEEGEDDGNPIISNINGFELSVETDDSNPVGSLKRRFAVAKDTRGITLLRGEPSFSSSDQILIDELIFYIQQNNLKAF
tara:strand:- start:4911 stop:7016 length:2106 start_codon:yes stop_codon:yes gene_type:complete